MEMPDDCEPPALGNRDADAELPLPEGGKPKDQTQSSRWVPLTYLSAMALSLAAFIARAIITLDSGRTYLFALSQFGFFSVLGAILCSLVFAISFHMAGTRLWRRRTALVGLLASYATTLMLLTSIFARYDKPIGPDDTLVPGRPNYILPPIMIDHPIYFENGKGSLPPRLQGYYTDVARALATCATSRVELAGFASSAGYRQDPLGKRNLDLANRRAVYIGRLFNGVGAKNVSVHSWTTLGDMELGRGILDRPMIETRLLLRETLNRRVDLKVKLGADCARVPDNAF